MLPLFMPHGSVRCVPLFPPPLYSMDILYTCCCGMTCTCSLVISAWLACTPRVGKVLAPFQTMFYAHVASPLSQIGAQREPCSCSITSLLGVNALQIKYGLLCPMSFFRIDKDTDCFQWEGLLWWIIIGNLLPQFTCCPSVTIIVQM